jgi:CHASE2 domain-containing sensor protein
MPLRVTRQCLRREATEALCADELTGGEQQAAERHLEECTSCRLLFRQRTAARFPRFRGYTVVRRIGEGGFGVVYKAVHNAKERTEALKVLFSETPIREAYFQNEVRFVAKLRHPNIATLYEARLSAPPLYYAMELVEGEQIDKYFVSRHTPLADRIRTLQVVARAIDYAHSQGVVHRDLKPQNILIDAQGQPRILDFGIAKKVGLRPTGADQPESPEGFLGTFGYVAPEQVAGEPVDARADVYALGALLYHCVTGEPARFATRPGHLTRLLQERQVARAGDLAEIIARCVHPVPEQRYSSCAALADDLDNYLVGRPVNAYAGRTRLYEVMRGAAWLLRTRPLTVRVALVAIIVALLMVTRVALPRWYAPHAEMPPEARVALIEVTADSVAALSVGEIGADLPGLDVKNRKSWRLLYGRLMERLALARPQAVIWDYYFPDCQPEYDAGLLRGLAALRAAGVPTVIGTRELDINSEPVVCPAILEAAHACGTLVAGSPSTRPSEWIMPGCVQRGLAPPVPSLALVGFAAARYPAAELKLDVSAGSIQMAYRKRDARPGESHWLKQVDRVAFSRSFSTRSSEFLGPSYLIYALEVRASERARAQLSRYSVEDVLRVDLADLQHWFAGRTVVVGQTIPGIDQHRTWSGDLVFGCEMQALTVQALLSGTHAAHVARPRLAAAVLLWAVVAAAGIGLVPCSWRLSLRATAILAAVALTAGLAGSFFLAGMLLADYWQLQAVQAASTLLAVGGPLYLAKAIRERQLQLAPQHAWEPEPQTIATTLLATASDSKPGDTPGSATTSDARTGRVVAPADSSSAEVNRWTCGSETPADQGSQ